MKMVNCALVWHLLALLATVRAHSEKRAAILARRMVNLQSTLHFNSLRSNNVPVSMAEYYVASDSCPDVEGLFDNGDPVLLLSKMSTSYKNWHENGTVTMTIEKPTLHYDGIMGKPRGVFFGKLKKLELSSEDNKRLAAHFLVRHPDARHWLPGSDESHVHDTVWFEFVVESVYFIGGFGDRAFIGNISGDVYHQDLRDGESYSCNHMSSHDYTFPVEYKQDISALPDESFFGRFFQAFKNIVMNY